MQRQLWTATLLMAVLSGCAWLGDSVSSQPQADTTPLAVIESGVSAVSPDGPIWLAAEQPGLSVVGKDFLFAGPMMVNREGQRRQYLWFALGSTIDRRITGAEDRMLQSVVFSVDGTLMTFELISWDVADQSQPYQVPYASEGRYAARVTQSQIRKIAGATTLEAYVTDRGSRSPRFELVHGVPASWVPGAALQADLTE